LFKPKNKIELDSVRRELINLNEENTMYLMKFFFYNEYNHLDVYTNTVDLITILVGYELKSDLQNALLGYDTKTQVDNTLSALIGSSPEILVRVEFS
jgi:hypothetical protein